MGRITTMAFVVSKPNGTWEVRESRRSPAGPRSRTLATFHEFTPEIADQVADRSSKPVDNDDIRSKVVRAGAPVRDSEVEHAAKTLLRQMSLGQKPRRALARLIADSLPEVRGSTVSHEAERMKLWVGASMGERSEALIDLLGLGDALPPVKRRDATIFPRIESSG